MCSSGQSPAPAYPKDGFYSDIEQDVDKGVQVVQDLVQQFYSDHIVYDKFINAQTFAALEGVTTVPHFTATDMPTIYAADVTTANYLDILATVAGQMERLTLIDVPASQAIATDGSGSRLTGGSAGACDQSGDLFSCPAQQQCVTAAPFTWGVLEKPACVPGLPFTEPITQASAQYPIAFSTISSTFEIGEFVDGGCPQYFASLQNTRGKISADLTPFQAGIVKVFLKVQPAQCIHSYWTYDPYVSSFGLTCTVHLGQAPPVTADSTFHLWSAATLPLGGLSTTDQYVTGSDQTPSPMGDCVLGNRDIYGWEVADAVAIVQPDFTTVPDPQDCCSCTVACDAGSPNFALASIHVNIPLGSDNFAGSAGALTLSAAQPSPALATPSGLRYSVASTVESITGLSAQHLQFMTSQNLIDILTNNSFAYTISFYTAADAGSKDGTGFYQPTGAAYTTLFVQNPDGASATNRLRITTTTSSASSITDYIYTAATGQWEMDSGSGLRKESRASTWDASNTFRTETLLVMDSNNQLVYKEINVYQLFAWGQEMVTNIVDPDGSALTSTWTFYTNASTDGGAYRQVKQQIDSNGHWVQYQYDQNGRETNRVTQYLNSAVGSAANSNRVSTRTYSTNAPQITIIDFLLGTEIGRRYQIISSGEVDDIQCQTQGAALNALDNLTNITKKYTTGSFAGQPYRTQKPDRTVLIYLYSTNANQKATVLLAGVPDPASDTNIVNGTITTTTTMLGGQVLTNLVTSRAPGAADITIAQDTYTYIDSRKRSYTVTHLNGTTEQFNYACCGLDSATDRDGVATYYFYDVLRRQFGLLRNSITTSNVLDPSGGVLATIRVGSDNSAITTLQQVFDLAGRLMFETNALGGGTVHTKYFDASGQLVKQTTYPDGGTRIETYYQDGSLLSLGGTAVQPASYLYGLDGDGPFTIERRLDANGGTNEWVKTSTDMVRRTYKTVFAAASGSPYAISFYNNIGQLTNQVDPDGVSTLYAYNDKGEQTYSVLDSNRNYVIDFTGADRIPFVTNDVVGDNGTNVRRTRTYVWATSANASTLVSTVETSVDGLRSWSTTWNNGVPVTRQSATAYDPTHGYRFVTNTAPDSSYSLNVYQNGLLVSATSKDANGSQLSHITYGYDAHGRRNTAIDARTGRTTSYFNNADQVSATAAPSPDNIQGPQVTTKYFDNMGRVWKVTLPDNTSLTNESYPTGLLKRAYGSQTYPAAYGYDAQGRVKTLTNYANFASGAGARVTSWNYDPYRGWLASKDYPDATTGNPPAMPGTSGPKYTYTPAGRLQTRIWLRGIGTTNAYDSCGLLSSVNYSDSTPNVANTYDRRGRLATITCNGITTTCVYNDANQQVSQSYSGGLLDGLSVTNSYDTLTRRTNLTVMNTTTPVLQDAFGYDGASRLQSATDNTGAAAYSVTYVYLANSPLLAQLVFKQGATTRMTTTRQYDFANRLSQMSSVPSASSPVTFGYSFNNANQRTVCRLSDGTYWRYQYDSLGQVNSGHKFFADETPVPGQQFDYAFDNVGNRTQTRQGGDQNGANQRLASYHANLLNQYTNRDVPGYLDIIGLGLATNAVKVNDQTAWRKGEYFRQELTIGNGSAAVWTNVTVSATGQSSQSGNRFLPKTQEQFTYDADGNLTSDGQWNYDWDAENRLVGITNGTTAGPQQVIRFEYDPTGRRIHKQVWRNSSGVGSPTNDLKFLYDGWNLLAELNTTNGLARSYLWGLDLSGSMQGAGGVGGLLEVAYYGGSATNCFVAFDGNGNVAALVNAADSTTAAQYDYGPFGEILRATGPMAKTNPCRFSTKYQDDEADLLYYGYRYYNASTGRWLSRDPLEEDGGHELYGFVFNNPVYGIDALGLVCECAKHMMIQNIKKLNYSKHGIPIFGHHFEVAIDLEYYLEGDGLAKLEWWEKTDKVPIWYGDAVKPNEWADLYQLYGNKGMFTTLNDWDSRDTSTLVEHTVILKDEPVIGMLSAKAVARTTEFRIIIDNPKCCCRATSAVKVTAKQVLSTKTDKPQEIQTQEFNDTSNPTTD